jgi:hypothetical protein
MALKCIGAIKEYPTSGSNDLKTFMPNTANAGIYANGFGIYGELYTALKETMHRAYRGSN